MNLVDEMVTCLSTYNPSGVPFLFKIILHTNLPSLEDMKRSTKLGNYRPLSIITKLGRNKDYVY